MKLGNVLRLGASFFQDLTTGEKGADAGLQALIGYQLGTKTPKGVPMTTPSPATHSLLVGPYQHNFTTGENSVTVGFVVGIGGDVTFNPQTYSKLASQCSTIVP